MSFFSFRAINCRDRASTSCCEYVLLIRRSLRWSIVPSILSSQSERCLRRSSRGLGIPALATARSPRDTTRGAQRAFAGSVEVGMMLQEPDLPMDDRRVERVEHLEIVERFL